MSGAQSLWLISMLFGWIIADVPRFGLQVAAIKTVPAPFLEARQNVSFSFLERPPS